MRTRGVSIEEVRHSTKMLAHSSTQNVVNWQDTEVFIDQICALL